MGFNFPNAPASGEVFTPAGGPTFLWDGAVWKGVSQGVPTTAYVSDIPPLNPAAGQLWWESDTGNLYVWYTDGDSGQWVQVNGTPAGYQTARDHNYVTNPAFQISQESGVVASGGANGFYIADEWRTDFAGAGAINANTSSAGGVNNSLHRMHVTVTTPAASPASTDFYAIMEKIEGIKMVPFGYGTSTARSAVLRFWSANSIAGTHAISLRNGVFNRSFVGLYTQDVANVWEEKTIIIPGDTTGTWATDNTPAMEVRFMLGAGTGRNIPTLGQWNAGGFMFHANAVNTMATTSAAIRIADVGLYLDPDNTGVAPKWQMPDEAEELRACQRYWQQSYGICWTHGVVNGAGMYLSVPLSSVPRAAPALTGVSNTASSFPATPGTFTFVAPSTAREIRNASAANANGGGFATLITANARM